MSKLQKSAWGNLAAVIGIMLIAGPATAFLAHANAHGVIYVAVCVIVPCVLAPVFYVWRRKMSLRAYFDEREKLIFDRATLLASAVVTAFLMGVCIVPFFLLGGQNLVHVYFLPVIFLSTMFVAQLVHSSAILVQCALEDEDAQ